MRQFLVLPYHDPDGILFNNVKIVTPLLKKYFQNAVISVTPSTQKQQKKNVKWLSEDPFFVINYNSVTSNVGDHFISAYKNAIIHTNNNDLLHLVTLDRLIFALSTDDLRYKFIKDIENISIDETPLMFIRSKKAWRTHPFNYFASENLMTKTGELLLGKTLDFAWCHLVLSTGQLKKIIPKYTRNDIVIFAETALFFYEQINAIEVDWLSWEDPFTFGKDPIKFKKEKEVDAFETEKRLRYVLPTIDLIFKKYHDKVH